MKAILMALALVLCCVGCDSKDKDKDVEKVGDKIEKKTDDVKKDAEGVKEDVEDVKEDAEKE